MADPRFILDSTVVINHLNKKIDVDAFFSAVPEFEWYVSIVTEIEALSKPGMTTDEEHEAMAFLARFVALDIDQKIKKETIDIRRATKLRLPDAVIAATAVILDATCLSNDTHLLNLVWPGYRVAKPA
jgi:predicted nucleic acid-binding protein